MKNVVNLLLVVTSFFIIGSCRSDVTLYDATGTFEATEVIISSEATGKIIKFDVAEGALLKQGQSTVTIDAINLELQKAQVEASIDAVKQKRNDSGPQTRVFQEQLHSVDAQTTTLKAQLDVLTVEQIRVYNLFIAGAGTQKQMDEINGKIKILNKQIDAAQSQKSVLNAQILAAKESVAIQNRGIVSVKNPMIKQVDLINNQISKAQVINPIDGTLLTKYAEEGEFTAIGKPLYKVANLSAMILRAYISGDQLGQVKLGQEVSVFIDQNQDEYKKYNGVITWVSDKAEFTPKTIQTKNERANLVYAIKINVLNDGYLKIGMYGEVRFSEEVNKK